MRKILDALWGARLILALYIALLVAGWLFGEAVKTYALPEMRPMNEPMIHKIVMGALIAFIIAAAIPFVPGAEIGFALLLLFGAQAVPLVYFGMVGALLLSYCVARLLPSGTLSKGLGWLGLSRASALIAELEAAPPDQKTQKLSDLMPSRFGQTLLKNRYILLILALNLPGNTLIGGGGGLAMLSGLSGVFGFWPYLGTILIAVAPVPLFFLLMP